MWSPYLKAHPQSNNSRWQHASSSTFAKGAVVVPVLSFGNSLRTVLISCSCCNTSPQTWWLNPAGIFIPSQFWKLQVQNHGAGQGGIPWKARGENPFFASYGFPWLLPGLQPHRSPAVSPVCIISPGLTLRKFVVRSRSQPDNTGWSLYLKLLHLITSAKIFFSQIRSHSQVSGIMT